MSLLSLEQQGWAIKGKQEKGRGGIPNEMSVLEDYSTYSKFLCKKNTSFAALLRWQHFCNEDR